MSWQEIVEKYNLDVSIVNFNELIGRIDAEYYKPLYIQNIGKIKRKNFRLLKEVSIKITDFGAYSQNSWIRYLDSGENIFIRNQDIEGFFIKSGEKIYISDEVYKKLSLHLEERDILIQRAGTLGKASIVLSENLPSTANQNLAQVKVNEALISPFYLIAFLNCFYGISSFERLATGNVQPWLNLEQINNLPIPIPNNTLQFELTSIIISAKRHKDESNILYSQAEALLLAELGLSDYIPNEANTSIRDLLECLQDDRFDAEYWMPKYDEIVEKIKEYKGGFSTIGKEFKQIKNNFKRQDNKEYNYIEIGDVNVSTGEVEYNAIIGKELPANAKIKFGKKQLITSKVRPNRGATAILNNHEGFIGSGAFTALVEKGNINLATLMVYLKTEHIRELLLRYNTGTSYPVIIDGDILELPIPLFDRNIQAKISELINSSSIAREQSKTLLEKAKRAVEIFIEQDEEKALEYLA